MQIFAPAFSIKFMLILNLIKLLLALAFFYFLLVLIRTLLYIGKSVSRREHGRAPSSQNRYKKNEDGRTIELDKDQYKVE